jgi:hypothetical protein
MAFDGPAGRRAAAVTGLPGRTRRGPLECAWGWGCVRCACLAGGRDDSMAMNGDRKTNIWGKLVRFGKLVRQYRQNQERKR